jgi:autotransporter-associated beta strand protein
VFKPQTKGFFKGFFGLLAFTIWSAAADAQQPAFTQTFQSEGPGPAIGPAGVAGSRDFAASGQGSTSGAVQAVLTSTTDANTMFIGGVNGGIWVTHNAGVSWTPLTDNLSSLSIASLSYNATNSQILYAGLGITSNGAVGVPGGVDSRGGFRDGILVSNNGGATWSEMSTTVTGSLIGKSVISVVGNGTTVLAATAEPQDARQLGGQGYGLYRSVGGGAFTLVSGLPSGAATALVGSGTAASPYYVSINTGAGGGVYRSVNNGDTWTAATTIATGQIGRLATAANGAVALATYNTDGSLARLQLSQNGTSWTDLALPPVINGKQGATNLALAIDPTDTNVVYIAGDTRTSAPYTATAYRVVLDSSTGQSSFETLTDSGTADNSSAHADSRNFAFDINGRMILVGDGGVYARTDPLSDSGTWTGLNNGLALRESYGVAFDAISKRLVVAAQDNGVAVQLAPRGQTFTPLAGGDGVNVAINDHTYASSKESIQYYSTQNLAGLTRIVVDANGTIIDTSYLLGSPTSNKPGWNFVNVDPTHTDFTEDGDPDSDAGPSPGKQLPFSSRFVLNRNDPTRIAIGTNYLYVTTDALVSDANNRAPLTNLGTNDPLGGVTALAYGTNDNANAILAGVNGVAGARLFYSTTAAADSLQTLTNYAGDVPTGVVFDARSAARFFVADYTALWGSTDSGASFTDLTSNLTTLNIARPTSLEFISNNGVNALLVGGLPANTSALSPIAVAMSDGTGNLSGWAAFGRGLPNTIVNLLAYNPTVDVLAVGLYGRGVWTLYDVTSYFSTATVLQYGLADNDSAPDASFLTGARPLIKYGTGTLTISGTSSYTGSTTVNDGTLVVNGSIASSSNLLIEADGTVRGIGTLPQTVVNGTLAPGNNAIGTLTVNNGLTFNGGSTYQILASSTAASSTNVTGGAASLGGTVEAILQPGSFLPKRSFTILTATGGTTGTFAGVTSNYPFLLPSLSYDGNDVTLTVTPGGFAQGAQTPNQAAVGAVLDASVATASGDFANVINAFSLLTTGQAPAAFNAISGQNYAGFATTGVQSAQLFMNNLAQQAGTGSKSSGTAGRIALPDACDVACDVPEYRWSAWGGALGGVGTVAGSATASGLNFGIGGFAAGLDRRFDSGFVLGVTAGYTSATATMQSMPGSGTSNTAQVGLYGSWSTGALYVDALAGYARSENQMMRPISIPGLTQRTATGLTHADQFFGQLESGYRFDLGGALDPFVTPFVRLQGSTSTQGAFTESGADSLDLTVAAQTTNSLRSVVGTQFGGAADLGWREKLGLVFRLGWSHEYADTSRPVNANFAGAPASPFTVAGTQAPRDGAVLGLAASTAIAEATSVYLRYDGELAGGNTSHVFSGGVRIVW